MDPDLLEQAILDRMEKKGERKPKAIVLVHLYGMPAKMDRILEIAATYDIPVIEDAAEALGSSIGSRKCGTFGKLAVLSFNGNKIITTSGGGALLSDDKELIKKARFLATQARDDAPHYQHSEVGYNYRMSNIIAGIGRGQIKVLDERVKARRRNHAFYFENLGKTWVNNLNFNFAKGSGIMDQDSPFGIYFLKEPGNCFSNRWLTTILVNPKETGGITREDIRLALEEENIECRPLWKPMHMQPLYKDFPYYGKGVSDKLFKYGLCLPSGSNLSDAERSRVVTAIKKALETVLI
jgi:dTDP-4-amino-4,6-dideoxygalactose transaminase